MGSYIPAPAAVYSRLSPFGPRAFFSLQVGGQGHRQPRAVRLAEAGAPSLWAVFRQTKIDELPGAHPILLTLMKGSDGATIGQFCRGFVIRNDYY